MPISKFKATCLAVLDEVSKTGEPLLVTRFGEPLAQIVSPPPQPNPSWFGCMAGTATLADDLIEPAVAEDEWDVLSDPDSVLYPEKKRRRK